MFAARRCGLLLALALALAGCSDATNHALPDVALDDTRAPRDSVTADTDVESEGDTAEDGANTDVPVIDASDASSSDSRGPDSQRSDGTADSTDALDALDTSDGSDTNVPPGPEVVPERILFIGNSFTFGGPVPEIVDILANDAGWPDPHVEMSAFGGERLAGHRMRSETLALVDEGDWDVVVLQESSTRPTDSIGDPEQFKTDATWFHDRIKATSPSARVILFETWARHPDHEYYPRYFDDPGDMQAQLRFHYFDAAESWIPSRATSTVDPPVEVAPVGDAWERHLNSPGALRLHADDDWHAARNGQYLNGLVIYGTIYERSTERRTAWLIDGLDAQRLQQDADAITGQTTPGGPDGVAPPLGLTPGDAIQIDLGRMDDMAGAGWTVFGGPLAGSAVNLETTAGERSSVDVAVTTGFGGTNTNGLAGDPALGWPDTATNDSLFCGSFDDHTTALTQPGALTVAGLDPGGRYTLTLFGSRAGTDGGRGRLTRYTATGTTSVFRDLEVGDNSRDVAVISGVAPDTAGELEIEVAVSPDGAARFCYLGVLVIERE